MINPMTIGGFLQLLEPLRHLPADTPLSIGLGCETFNPDGIDEELQASARRTLLYGDTLYCFAAVAVVLEADTDKRLTARLCLDTEYATYTPDSEWDDYIREEAVRLGIITTEDAHNEPNTKEPTNNASKTDSHEKEERKNRGRDCRPDRELYPRGRDFDPDRDAIGI